MNPDAEQTTHPEPTEQQPDKPRGDCTGCKFNYQLGTARSGEYKGQLVIRKHNSRTGPGLCEGSQRPPKGAETDEPACCEPCEGAETDETVTYVEAAPAQVHGFMTPAVIESGVSDDTRRGPWITASFDSECDGCSLTMFSGDEIRADGEGGWLCEDCGADTPTVIETRALSAPAELTVCLGCPDTNGRTDHSQCTARAVAADGRATFTSPAVLPDPEKLDPWTKPAPASAAELPPVHGQPEPDRDQYGRYKIHGTGHTRATTFAKSASSTHALTEWRERMTVLGLVQRRDLLALAHGMHVKRDRVALNSIVQQAKDTAGVKVAANLGTAYHAFSERLDADLMTLDEVPQEYRGRCAEYVEAVRAHGLTTRPEWIERTTAVRADQVSALVPVAGTLDRIFQLPNGELVIGDLKTGADLSYGWGEIAVQLALYAHGCNTFGLFDWNTKTWQQHADTVGGQMLLNVRTDYGIVMHLPADGTGCTLYRIDLVKGWERAQVCGQVMTMQKSKDGLAMELTAGMLDATPYPPPLPKPGAPQRPPVERPATDWDHAVSVFSAATTQDELASLYQYAMDSGLFTDQQLGTLAAIGTERLGTLAPA